MKWWPGQCSCGDMIRVRIGSIYHYGIFVSEDEIIQFGPPPVAPRREGEEVLVCATDIEGFCCGSIVETAQLDRKEIKTRISPKETVRLARSRLGEGGYNLIHNNCEHFVYQCVFGVKKSTQEEDARSRWANRPICDVYVAPIPEGLTVEAVYPPERNKQIEKTRHEGLRLQRYYVWKLLEYAVSRSFFKDLSALNLQKNRHDKWTCEELFLSLSHTDGYVAVAVSNSPVGIDLENIPAFYEKFADGSTVTAKALQKCLTREEQSAAPSSALDFLRLWTKKESIFKCFGSGKFVPHKTDTTQQQTESCRLSFDVPVFVSICGEKAHTPRYYLYEDGTAHLISSDLRKSE